MAKRKNNSTGPGHRIAGYSALVLWLAAILVIAGGVWFAFYYKPSPARNFYILQWLNTGKCTVSTALPDWGQFRTLWQASDQKTAFRKLDELEKSFKCR
jgi:hypothetical protein